MTYFSYIFSPAASKMNYQSYYVVILELICPLTTKVKSVYDTLVAYSLAELMSAFAIGGVRVLEYSITRLDRRAIFNTR